MRRPGPWRRWSWGAALACVVAAGGCRWLPLHRPEASLDPRGVGVPDPDAIPPELTIGALAPPGVVVPLPTLPLRPVSDAEALAATPPTPLLDAAESKAAAIAEVVTVPDGPPVDPQVGAAVPSTLFLAETSKRADPAPGEAEPSRDAAVRQAILDEPVRAPSPPGGGSPASATTPDEHWRSGLESLIGLARAEAARERADGRPGPWSAREKLLVELASDDGTLWQAILEALAVASEPVTGATPASGPEPSQDTGDSAAEATSRSELAIVALCFCRRVDGFGSYDPAERDSLEPGRSVGLYWEVEGLKTERDGDWFKTRLSCSLAIVPEGVEEPAWRRTLDPAEDACRRPRRDFFVNTRLTIPDSLKPGRYELRLTLEDRVAKQSVSQTLPFAVVGDGGSPEKTGAAP
jgi:hypothetical protein